MNRDKWEAHTTTVPEKTLGKSSTSRYFLNVITAGLSATHPLPDEGEVSIGRADTNTIQVHDRSLSRQHAMLRIAADGTMTVEDLASSNGTSVRGTPLRTGEAVPITPGEVIDLGATMVIVQRRSSLAKPRRLWGHEYFEARLEDECARAEQGGAAFAVLRVSCSEAQSAVTQQVLFERLRPIDVVGVYAPGELEALLVGTSPEAAAELAGSLGQTLGERRVKAHVGVASWPRDGRSPDGLFASASGKLHAGAARPMVGAGADAIVVADDAMLRLYKLVERVAAGTISVLILGETGAGKEVLAERLHKLSPRAGKPFVSLNCAALTESLLESELFGHERGAFTGAVAAKIGLLESADGGTVFLDEVGEMPASTQAKLLRVIETRQVLRVGGLKPRPIDVRFLSATNRDLEAEVARGAFRRDLFFRLNGISLTIPPLRERPAEIEALARLFLDRAAAQLGRQAAPQLAPEALELLQRYSWPGNIRELKNVMERAALLCVGTRITREHLPTEKMRATFAGMSDALPAMVTLGEDAGQVPTSPAPMFAPPPVRNLVPSFSAPLRADPTPGERPTEEHPPSVREEIEALERRRILDALAQCAGNQTKAAKMLGMSRRTLLHRLDSYGVARPRKGSEARGGDPPTSEPPED